MVIILVWVLAAAYVILGNYLYFAKVLHEIDRETGKGTFQFWPSAQLKQIKQYVEILDRRNERPWYYLYLRYNLRIGIVLLALWLSLAFMRL